MVNSRVQRPALVIAVLGGILAVVSAFLSWSTGGFVTTGVAGTTTSGKTTSTAGISVTEGKIALAAGIVVIAAAIGRALLRADTPRLVAGLVVLAGSAALLWVGITETLDISGQEGFTLTGTTVSGEEISIGSETSVGIGLWLTIAAGVIAAVGGALGLWRARRAGPDQMREGGAGL